MKRRITVKLIALSLIVIGTASFLAGCGDKQDTTASGSASAEASQTTYTVPEDNGPVKILIDGNQYVVHTDDGIVSLHDWFDEYGSAAGWTIKDGEIYTPDGTHKLDMNGWTLDEDGLFSYLSFNLVTADSEVNAINIGEVVG